MLETPSLRATDEPGSGEYMYVDQNAFLVYYIEL